jgi:phenylacetate-CoA ligase
MSTATQLHDPVRERYGSLLPQRLPEHIARLRWSREQVAAHQRDELRRLLAYAIERSPYHARRLAGIDPDAFELADLASLPAMTKPDMMASFEDVVADHRVTRAMVDGYLHSATERNALLLDDYICLASGGSSGVRGVFVLRAETVPEMIGAVLRSSLARALQGGGPPPGGLVVGMAAAPTAMHATRACGSLMDGTLGRVVHTPATLPLDEIVSRLNAGRPHILVSYPGILCALARERRAGRLDIAPVTIVSTGEQLTADVRGEVVDAFGIWITDSFGSSEGLFGSTEPGGEVFTFASDVAIVELVDEDGRPTPVGQSSARTLVTSLISHAQPVIRYDLGDSFIREPDAEEHGHLRARVAGRVDAMLAYGDLKVHPLTIRAELVRTPEVVEYQVRQTPAGAEIAVVAAESLDAGELAGRVAQSLANAGLRDAQVQVRRVRALERDVHTGKVRRFIPLSPPVTSAPRS